MREILFRGKDLCDKWHFGLLARYKDGIYIAEACVNTWVNPESVGQYTGLTDMNERKIYEGDIVHIHYDIMPDAGYIGAVFYNAELTQFQVEHPGYITSLGEAFSTGKVEVIGNRWDNPELLKKE